MECGLWIVDFKNITNQHYIMKIILKQKEIEVTLNVDDDFDVTKSGSGGWEWAIEDDDEGYIEGSFRWEDGKVIDWDGTDQLPYNVPQAFMFIGLSIDELPDVVVDKQYYLEYLRDYISNLVLSQMLDTPILRNEEKEIQDDITWKLMYWSKRCRNAGLDYEFKLDKDVNSIYEKLKTLWNVTNL